jgi:hypothetical protein
LLTLLVWPLDLRHKLVRPKSRITTTKCLIGRRQSTVLVQPNLGSHSVWIRTLLGEANKLIWESYCVQVLKKGKRPSSGKKQDLADPVDLPCILKRGLVKRASIQSSKSRLCNPPISGDFNGAQQGRAPALANAWTVFMRDGKVRACLGNERFSNTSRAEVVLIDDLQMGDS